MSGKPSTDWPDSQESLLRGDIDLSSELITMNVQPASLDIAPDQPFVSSDDDQAQQQPQHHQQQQHDTIIHIREPTPEVAPTSEDPLGQAESSTLGGSHDNMVTSTIAAPTSLSANELVMDSRDDVFSSHKSLLRSEPRIAIDSSEKIDRSNYIDG